MYYLKAKLALKKLSRYYQQVCDGLRLKNKRMSHEILRYYIVLELTLNYYKLLMNYEVLFTNQKWQFLVFGIKCELMLKSTFFRDYSKFRIKKFER